MAPLGETQCTYSQGTDSAIFKYQINKNIRGGIPGSKWD